MEAPFPRTRCHLLHSNEARDQSQLAALGRAADATGKSSGGLRACVIRFRDVPFGEKHWFGDATECKLNWIVPPIQIPLQPGLDIK